MRKAYLWAVILFVVLVGVNACGKNSAPKPDSSTSQASSTASSILEMDAPQTWVNDFAGILPNATKKRMEDSLRTLSTTTSNQIMVLTVSDLEGEDPTLFATKVGNLWGVGQKNINNGVVIVIKPKVKGEKGQVAIAPGRGLEGALPKVFCQRIIEDEMIPCLKANNDYSAALWSALHLIMPVCRGEYSYETYSQSKTKKRISRN